MFMRIAAGAGIAVLAAVPAWAEGATVRLDHLAARVIVIPEARSNITAEVVAGKGSLPKPTLHVSGAELTVSGGLPASQLHNCHIRDHGRGVSLGFWSRVRTEELPVVTLHTPLDVSIDANGAIVGEIGPTRTLKLRQERCGGWKVGDVSDRLGLELQGLGDIEVGQVGDANLQLQGLGDVHVRSVKALTANLQGLGDLRIDEVNGPVEASLDGMGGLKIKGGHATTFKARLDGLGDIVFGGVADTVDASADGMGSITVAKATGDVHKSAAGFSHIKVGR